MSLVRVRGTRDERKERRVDENRRDGRPLGRVVQCRLAEREGRSRTGRRLNLRLPFGGRRSRGRCTPLRPRGKTTLRQR